jgi:hypothetical protein
VVIQSLRKEKGDECFAGIGNSEHGIVRKEPMQR